MINNLGTAALLGLALSACAGRQAEVDPGFQGVVEFEETVVAFEVGGRVNHVSIEEGDSVEAGSVVAALDDELLQSTLRARLAEVASAKAEVQRVRSGARREDIGAMAARVEAAKATEALTTKNLNRERTLFEKNVVAEASVDQLEGQLARATAEREALEQNLLLLKHGAKREDVLLAESRAAAAAAAIQVDEVRLERHELRAPSDGLVLDVFLEEGEIVAAGTPVLSLADTRHPYVDVFVPQGKIEGIALGGKAKVRTDALGAALDGTVEHVARRAEFTPRFLFSERERPNLVIRVRVRVDDPEQRLHAGVPAFVTIAGRNP